jgi:putative RNA 2'-phosphotransferase
VRAAAARPDPEGHGRTVASVAPAGRARADNWEVDDRRLVKVSKYLARHLRHDPGRLGLVLEPGGWVRVDDLLRACAARGMPISRAELDEVVERNDKRRYSFDDTGERIRASQGHSAPVDLQLDPAVPPPELFHGTAAISLDRIMRSGLLPMRRHHVHLSLDVETARRVGRRHGKPVVLRVDAAGMASAGSTFFVADNGVWLVDEVPPRYLSIA